LNGDRNGEKAGSSKLSNSNDRPPSRSGSSSSRSTPNLKTKDVSFFFVDVTGDFQLIPLFAHFSSTPSPALLAQKEDRRHQTLQLQAYRKQAFLELHRRQAIHHHLTSDPLIPTNDHHLIPTADLSAMIHTRMSEQMDYLCRESVANRE
jgi:hypothetical protein